ncbi:hypothetical protein AB0C86_36765 [Streptomyces lavendulae]|uniref:hypothetical protein n=1 Tax=Streptomyces lavendulae TaxID=1914 RepID=UPI00340CCEFE
MFTPAPDPAAVDPLAESMAEAVQTSAAAFRLMLTISDAVRRAAQKQRQGQEEELAEPEEKLAPGWAADALRSLLDDRVLADLMSGEDWPAMAGQMGGLQEAGVDLTSILPQLSQAAKTVYQAVEANQARIQAAGTDRWAELALRRALALVRGRPFAAIDPQRYARAEPVVPEMVSAIADVAYELSSRRREAADYADALWAAHQGRLAAEENELLHRQIFLAHHGADEVDALREAAARLARINEGLGGGVDMEAETAQLLQMLLPRTAAVR